MNLETKITIYKFTPQLFTLTRAFPDHGVGTEERCYYDDELYRVYKFDWEIQNGWLYLYYSDGYTFIIEYPSVSGRYFYGTAEDGFEIRLEWVDGRSIRKKVS